MTNATEAIERLRELHKRGTPEPWLFNPSSDSFNKTSDTHPYGEAFIYPDYEYDTGSTLHISKEDLELVLEGRNLLPLLLAEYDRLKQQLAEKDAAARKMMEALEEIEDLPPIRERERREIARKALAERRRFSGSREAGRE